MQKNNSDEEIPLLPGFEALLLETPPELRTGWAFVPQSLQNKLGQKVRHQRPDSDWVGKVISRIGKEANIVVEPGDKKLGRGVKLHLDTTLEDLAASNCVSQACRHW
jgi:hypothetical protein